MMGALQGEPLLRLQGRPLRRREPPYSTRDRPEGALRGGAGGGAGVRVRLPLVRHQHVAGCRKHPNNNIT
eukprot:668602-Pyramimonas_sp.AAC.1